MRWYVSGKSFFSAAHIQRVEPIASSAAADEGLVAELLIEGVASITLGSVTVAATGEVGSAVGTASITLGAVTATGAGATAVAGAAAVTLGTATAAGAGAVEVAGTGSPTLGSVTADGAGAVAVAGAGAATLGEVTAAGAGAVAVAAGTATDGLVPASADCGPCTRTRAPTPRKRPRRSARTRRSFR